MATITIGDRIFDSAELNSFIAFRRKMAMTHGEAVAWMSKHRAVLLKELVKHSKVEFLDFWCLSGEMTAADIVTEAIDQNNIQTFTNFIDRVLPKDLRNELIAVAEKKPLLEQAAWMSKCVALNEGSSSRSRFQGDKGR